jgi:uncharacterized protein (DUF2252 family)
MSSVEATHGYDQWLARQTKVVDEDVAVKHERMESSPFIFLRATYYLWVARWAATLPELSDAPRVGSVGDLHMENFGTWRDAEGRLVWGINDFDEAHVAPYTNDLVRLATSVLLAARARNLRISGRKASAAILGGYVSALHGGGRPIVLAEQRRWLRTIAVQQLKDPAMFWRRLLAGAMCTGGDHPADVAQAVMPDGCVDHAVHRRRAGIGSLGRPRFVVVARLGGGYIARELKALVPSAHDWVNGSSRRRANVESLLKNAVRVRDPYYRVMDRWLTRRLAPDCTKLDIHALTRPREQSRLLRAMGAEVANIHLASPTRGVIHDLSRRREDWLHEAASVMAEIMIADWKEWKRRS